MNRVFQSFRLPPLVLVLLALTVGFTGEPPRADEDLYNLIAPGSMREPRPDRALVYILRDDTGNKAKPIAIHVDGRPVGYLPRDAFLVAWFEPGLRVVTTKHSVTKFDVRANNTYLLNLKREWGSAIGHEFSGGWVEVWQVLHPAGIEKRIQARSLLEVEMTQAGWDELAAVETAKRARKLYEKARRHDHNTRAVTEFEDARYWTSEEYLEEFSGGRKGRLWVSDSAVRFEMKNYTIEIPTSRIQELDRWDQDVVVRYAGDDGEEKLAFFCSKERSPYWSDRSNAIFLAIAYAAGGFAGNPYDPPSVIPRVRYRHKGQVVVRPMWNDNKTGYLSIESGSLWFHNKHKSLEIPLSTIRQVSLQYYLVVEHGDDEASVTSVLNCLGNETDVYVKIQAAREQASAVERE